ncbi:MAG: hypothetical protein CMB53_03310 [Euryarchaeota archaeon]|nr:hypothetical protein [Euryarchaeota archaeon]
MRGTSLPLVVLIVLSASISAHAQGTGVEVGTTFGVESGSIFDIEPGSEIGINVNFTNNEGFDDDAIVSISGPAGWNISWENHESPSMGHLYELAPGSTEWVGYSIESPVVSGGFPLSESLHHFSMMVQSLGNSSSDWYNFSLRYGFFDGATIVEGGGVSSIEPGSTDVFEIILRNDGNSWRDLGLEIVPLDSDSQPVGQSDLFFAYGGWSASVIDRWQLENVAPNGTAVARIQIDSPPDDEGSLFFEAIVWSEGDPDTTARSVQGVNIVPRVGGAIETSDDGCSGSEIVPGGSCQVMLEITNTGDITSSFDLNVIGEEEWLDVELSISSITIDSGNTISGVSINTTVAEATESGKVANITVQLIVDGWSPGHVSFNIISGKYFEWTLDMSTSEIIGGNNLTSTWTLTNSGNGPDGIVANLDSNVVTEFSFLPPLGSSFDPNSGFLRSFELLDIEPGGRVSFVAWMIVPEIAPVETQAVLTIEVRSTRDPSIIFTGSEMAIIPGEEVEEPEPEEDGFGEVAIKWMNKWLELTLTIIVVFLGTLGVMRALSIRSKEFGDSEGEGGPETENAEEWISRFKKVEPEETGAIESPVLPHSEFKTSFIEKSGGLSEKRMDSPDGKVVSEASDVLDRAQAEGDIREAIRLADEISLGDVLHPDNEILDVVDETKNGSDSSSEDEGPPDFDLEI